MVLSGCFKVGLVSLVITGVILIIAGGVLHGVFPNIYKDKVAKELVLSEDKTENMERFTSSPVATYMTFVFFNVTNPEEVNDRIAKPILQEVGPFIYRQDKVKKILDRNDTLGIIDYTETTSYAFVPEMNADVDLEAEIYHVNAPGIGFAAKFLNYLTLLNNLKIDPKPLTKPEVTGQLVERHKISEIIFDGYVVPAFVTLNKVAETLPAAIKSLVAGAVPSDNKWSAFGDKNGTVGPKMTVYSGVQGSGNLTVIQKIDDKERRPFFNREIAKWCNMINGTDGTQFPPDVREENRVFVYSHDVCRSLEFEYKRDVTIEKIPALRFVLKESVFSDPAAKDSENVCFCKKKTRENGQCFKRGILPLKDCMSDKGIIAMSAPHFLSADPVYLKMFEGLNPNFDKHGTFLDIEPNTGAVIQGRKRLQVNIVEERLEAFQFLNATSERRPFPFFWIQEGGQIDEENALLLRKKAIVPKESVFWGSVAAMALGIVLILLSIVVYIVKR